MSSTLLATGVVRASRPLTRRGTSEVFGSEVSLLTQVGDVLGETLKIVAFDREGKPSWEPQPGSNVAVIVEVDAGKYGLGGTFIREATPADVKSLPVGVASIAEPVGVPGK